MAILATLIAIGFGVTLFAIIKQKREEDRDCQYRKMQASPSTTRNVMGSGVGYPPQGSNANVGRDAQQTWDQNDQQTGSLQPSQAAKGNVRTYCMIDGRLIDE
jgi:hypothetical protein